MVEKINSSVDESNNKSKYLTALCLDKSKILETYIEEYHDNKWDDFLGQLQLSYILFLFLYCHESLSIWKCLIDTICKSTRILISSAKSDFVNTFMRILYVQLNMTPVDFFTNELSKENFLKPAINNLFESLRESIEILDDSVIEHKNRLFTFLQKKFDIVMNIEMMKNIENITNCNDSSIGIEGNEGGNTRNYISKFDMKAIMNEYDGNEDFPTIVTMEELNYETGLHNIDSMVMENSGDDNNQIEIRGDQRYKDTNNETITIESQQTTNFIPFNTNIISNEVIKSQQQVVSPIENKEMTLYSWRYPALYDARKRLESGVLVEDMVMAALRIICDENSNSNYSDSNNHHTASELGVVDELKNDLYTPIGNINTSSINSVEVNNTSSSSSSSCTSTTNINKKDIWDMSEDEVKSRYNLWMLRKEAKLFLEQESSVLNM